MSNCLLSPAGAVNVIQRFRHHPRWRLVENAPIMGQMWELARTGEFPRRRFFDASIALALLYHGVTKMATVNVKNFHKFPFQRVWNPLAKI